MRGSFFLYRLTVFYVRLYARVGCLRAPNTNVTLSTTLRLSKGILAMPAASAARLPDAATCYRP